MSTLPVRQYLLDLAESLPKTPQTYAPYIAEYHLLWETPLVSLRIIADNFVDAFVMFYDYLNREKNKDAPDSYERLQEIFEAYKHIDENLLRDRSAWEDSSVMEVPDNITIIGKNFELTTTIYNILDNSYTSYPLIKSASKH